MTNLEYIRNLNAKELAMLLVRAETYNDGDEGFDGEWVDFYIDVFVSPDGTQYYYFEDAVEHTVEWLNKERDK